MGDRYSPPTAAKIESSCPKPGICSDKALSSTARMESSNSGSSIRRASAGDVRHERGQSTNFSENLFQKASILLAMASISENINFHAPFVRHDESCVTSAYFCEYSVSMQWSNKHWRGPTCQNDLRSVCPFCLRAKSTFNPEWIHLLSGGSVDVPSSYITGNQCLARPWSLGPCEKRKVWRFKTCSKLSFAEHLGTK